MLYGHETLSLTLREVRRLCLLKNRELRRIFVPRRNEVTGDWKKLHKTNLMICTPHQILFGDRTENSEIGGTCRTYWREESCIQVFDGET